MTPQERLAKAQQQLQAAKDAVADAERRTCEAMGAAVMKEAADDAAFMETLRDILRRRATAKADRAAVAAFLSS